jgi:hypothetical protein
MEALLQAAAGFVVADLELEAEPSAVGAAQRSLDDSGLLLGEVHGVRENPRRLAQRSPGVQEIRVNYCGGHYYNLRPARFATAGPQRRQVRLHRHDDALVLDLPLAGEAIVPQRPWP